MFYFGDSIYRNKTSVLLRKQNLRTKQMIYQVSTTLSPSAYKYIDHILHT